MPLWMASRSFWLPSWDMGGLPSVPMVVRLPVVKKTTAAYLWNCVSSKIRPSLVTPTWNPCLSPRAVTASSMMLGLPSTRLTTSCSKPEDLVNTSTDFCGATGRRFARASPAPVTAAVRTKSLRPVIASFVVLLNLRAVVSFPMRAAGKRPGRIVSCPSKFAHALFRRIIRAADPALQIFEVAVQGELSFLGFRLQSFRVFWFRRGVGQERISLLFVEGREALLESLLGFRIQRGQRFREFVLVLRFVYAEQEINKAADVRSRRIGHDALRERG